MAKASIYWLVGEYCSLVPKIAPDVLRKAAKAFPNEVDFVLGDDLTYMCSSKDNQVCTNKTAFTSDHAMLTF